MIWGIIFPTNVWADERASDQADGADAWRGADRAFGL
jgi:hypothetical protein